jgi:hypothetical protein
VDLKAIISSDYFSVIQPLHRQTFGDQVKPMKWERSAGKLTALNLRTKTLCSSLGQGPTLTALSFGELWVNRVNMKHLSSRRQFGTSRQLLPLSENELRGCLDANGSMKWTSKGIK